MKKSLEDYTNEVIKENPNEKDIPVKAFIKVLIDQYHVNDVNQLMEKLSNEVTNTSKENIQNNKEASFILLHKWKIVKEALESDKNRCKSNSDKKRISLIDLMNESEKLTEMLHKFINDFE